MTASSNRWDPARTPREKQWQEAQAERCLLRAVACLDSQTFDKASAIVLGSMALLHLAASDPDGRARERAEQIIRIEMRAPNAREERPE